MSELDALLSNDSSVNNEIETIIQNENNVQDEPVEPTQSQPEPTKVVPETNSAPEEKTETATDEEYKPEEYQHNKNYKQAMEAERREKAELKNQFKQVREENEKLRQFFEQISKQSEQQQPKPPSFDEDPLEALKYRTEQQEKQFKQLNEERQQAREEYEKHLAMQKFSNAWESTAREFAQTNPDFREAYDFALKSRVAEYEEAGWSKKEAVAMANEDEMAIVSNAFRRGDNPADRIYRLAKLRGFQKAPATNQQQPANDNKQKMEMFDQGVKASKSLNNNSGTTGAQQLTVEGILAMSDKEFENFDWEEMKKLMA